MHFIGKEHGDQPRVNTRERTNLWKPLRMQRAKRKHRYQATKEAHERMRERPTEGVVGKHHAEVDGGNPNPKAEG